MERLADCRHKSASKIRLAAIAAAVILTLSIVIFMPLGSVTAQANYGYAVIEAESGRLLNGVNDGVRLPMASTTKVVTAIVAIENCADLDEYHDIPDRALGVEGSSIYLKKGEKLSVRELLYGLMLRSGNDSAEAIAAIVGGSKENFVAMMNAKARELGAENTHFTNPHGLHDEEHYTTARDLAVISAYAMKNDTFKTVVGTKAKIIGGVYSEKRYLTNKNKMLSIYEGGNGIKTGFTKAAGRCLVSGAERNGMQIVSVVLNCPDMWNVSASLMTEAFGKYHMVECVRGGEKIGDAVTFKGRKIPVSSESSFSYPVTDEEYVLLDTEIKVDNELKNVKQGDNIGKIYVHCGNRLLFDGKLISMENETK